MHFAAACLATLAALSPAPPPSAFQGTPLTVKVVSRDGTAIAYERAGSGPVLVLVAPALAERSQGRRFAALLAADFTVVHFDRRGRGDSGDSAPYAVQREIEDIEALIDANGGSAALFGSSSGAALALEAADRLGAKVSALVLFEPPYVVDDSRPPVPDDLFAGIGELVARGERGEAVSRFMVDGVGVPEEMLPQMRASPMWSGLERLAHTLPYDGACVAGLQTGKPLPEGRWTNATRRILILDGETSPAYLRHTSAALEAHLAGSRRRLLAGLDHSALFTAPQALVPPLREFLRAPAGDAR